jgi:hypothetical protein
VGAALATLIVTVSRPSLAVLALLLVIFAWLCYTLLRVNYATFTTSITVYIVFLLALAGLPEMATVKCRTLDTTIGGGFALIPREFPRLCRGGSRSLTIPGVHPETHYREPRSTRKGETGWTSMKA